MKKYELTIVVNVADDVRADQINLYEHDVCDGFEMIINHPNNTTEFKLSTFSLKAVKELKGVAKEDIQEMAKSMDMLELSESQMNWVISSYEDAQRQDPTATWNLIVEDLLYMLKTNFQG